MYPNSDPVYDWEVQGELLAVANCLALQSFEIVGVTDDGGLLVAHTPTSKIEVL